MAQGIPGISGYLQAIQNARQGEAAQLGQLQGILGLQNNMRQQAMEEQIAPLRMGILQAQAQKVQADAQREAAFRGALEAAGPGADQGTLASIAARFASPDRVLDTQQKSLDRQAQQQTTLAAARERIAAQIEAARQRGEDQRTLLQMNLEGRRQLAQMAAGLRQPQAPTPVTIQDPSNPSRNIVIDAKTRQPIGAAPKERTDMSAAGVAGETAGKVSMADQAIMDIRAARGLLFDKDGNLNRTTVAAMNVPGTAGLPGNPEARQAYSALYNAVEAKLRIETGAAATTREVESIVKRFIPQPWDSKTTANDKMDRLETFMQTTLGQIKGVRTDRLRSGAGMAPAAPAAPSNIDALLEKYK